MPISAKIFLERFAKLFPQGLNVTDAKKNLFPQISVDFFELPYPRPEV